VTQQTEKPTWIRRLLGWLFGAPFRELPPEFGDAVPSDLRVFEAQAEEAQYQSQGKVPEIPAQRPTEPNK
jgi:hypothetical protein